MSISSVLQQSSGNHTVLIRRITAVFNNDNALVSYKFCCIIHLKKLCGLLQIRLLLFVLSYIFLYVQSVAVCAISRKLVANN